jgi:hypothetical protein
MGKNCQSSPLNQAVKGLLSQDKPQVVNGIKRCKKNAHLSSKIAKTSAKQSGKNETRDQ